MRRIGLVGLLLVAGVAAGCAAAVYSPEPPATAPAGSATLHLYVDALPRETAGLRVTLGEVAAVGEDGRRVPLVLRAATLDGSAPRRQRMLAAGAIPAGRYRGVAVTVARATRSGQKGAGALQVPDEPRVLDVSFELRKGTAEVLSLRWMPGAAGDAVRFEPLFSIASPGEIAPEATALATAAGDTLVVFHKRSGAVYDVLRTGSGPRGVAHDSARRRAYVACELEETVEAFDLLQGYREQTLPLLLGDRPGGLAIDADGETVVVANAGSATVSVLDAPDLAERFRVPVAREPVSVVAAPTRDRMFVFSREGDLVTLVDTARGAAIATIETEDGPVHGALDGRGELLYVIHDRSPYLSVVEVEGLRVRTRAYVGIGARAVTVDPRTGRVYVSRRRTGMVEVFDPASLLPIETIDTGEDASFLEIGFEGEEVFAALPASREIRAYRLAGGRATFTTELGGAPAWIAVTGRR